MEGSPIGVADYFCPLHCLKEMPEFVAPVLLWLGSWLDGSPGGDIGEVPLGGPIGPTGPGSCELGGFGLPG